MARRDVTLIDAPVAQPLAQRDHPSYAPGLFLVLGSVPAAGNEPGMADGRGFRMMTYAARELYCADSVGRKRL